MRFRAWTCALLLGCGDSGAPSSDSDAGVGDGGSQPGPPELLAAGDFCGLAVDGETVYVAGKVDETVVGQRLFSVPRSGGTPQPLGGDGHAASCPLVLNGGFLYYQGGITANDPAISRMMAAGGAPTLVVLGGFGSSTTGARSMAIADDSIWYTRTTTRGRLLRVELAGFDGSAPATFQDVDTGDSDQHGFGAVAIANGRAYYATFGGATDTEIRHRATDNANASVIPNEMPYQNRFFETLVIADDIIYAAGGSTWEIPISGDAPAELVTSATLNSRALVVDGADLLLGGRGDEVGTIANSRIASIPRAGGTLITLVPDVSVAALAIDADHIYWVDVSTDKRGLWRAAR